ncbi:MAG: hypothetical protein WC716_02435 [Chitinophagaceae bacterium]|jgi:hypothetical protein
MKTLYLILLLYPVLLFAQEEPINVYRNEGLSSGLSYNSFSKRFDPQAYMNVQLMKPEYYHLRKIQKVELIQNDGSVFYSVEFDRSGRILEEKRKGNYYTISYRQHTDTVNNRDTLIQQYFSEDVLMRSDTFMTKYYSYRHKDTLISFSRQYSNIWYNGGLINEQNSYYNQQYLNKKIKPNQGYGITYDMSPLSGKKSKFHIYLHRKLKTNYDSSKTYPYSSEILDINFSAAADSGQRTLTMEQVKGHAFVKQYTSKNHRDCKADGACFQEPVFYFQSYTCGTGRYEAQQTRMRTSYGFTNRQDGLYDTFYSDYNTEAERLIKSDQPRMKTRADRNTIFRFRYTFF